MRLPGSFFHRFAHDSESSLLWSVCLLHMYACKMSICPIVPIDSPLKEENTGSWDWSSLSPIHTKCLLIGMWPQVNINSFKSYLGKNVCCIAYLWMCLPSSVFHHFPHVSESSLFWSEGLLHMSACKMSICPIVPIGSPLKEGKHGFFWLIYLESNSHQLLIVYVTSSKYQII